MALIEQSLLLFVALLWGATNPFLARGSIGVEKVKGTGLQKKIAELVFLATKWNYIVPFTLNQLGSVLFFSTLQSSELTLAVPVTNAVAFVITAAVSFMMGEQVPTWKSHMGILMIIVGTTVCMLEKSTSL